MIEQLAITTTPKYSFPQPTIDTSLPQRFIELSLHSLKHAQNQPFQLNQQYFQQNSPEQIQTIPTQLQPIPLKPRTAETVVAAVDTSTIKIGETTKGIVLAVRGATIWKNRAHYRYLRFGPFIFHVTEENKKQVYNALQRTYLKGAYAYEHNHNGSPSLTQMPTRVASLLERWQQTMLSKTINNGLILFDGSLTSGINDTPIQRIKEILDNARKKENVVLAFSKMTTLRFNGYLITDIPVNHKPPYLFKIADLKPKPPIILLGDVYVAKLTKGNYAFRLDIDKEVSTEQKIEALEKLLGNDLFSQSYPETLRLAHILCTFTANEVIAMQHFIARKYDLKIINRPDMHRLLFGPFGKGENCS